MEKRTDDNKSNGINLFSDNAVLREPLAPLWGMSKRSPFRRRKAKIPEGQKGVLTKWPTPTVSPY